MKDVVVFNCIGNMNILTKNVRRETWRMMISKYSYYCHLILHHVQDLHSIASSF